MNEDPRKSEIGNGQPNGQVAFRVVRQVKRADDKLISVVLEYPLTALGMALAVGYVVGRVMTRHG